MNAERQALIHAARGSSPEDPGPLLILADWLEEHGEADMGYACRWMAHKNKRPYQTRHWSRHGWEWVWMRDTKTARYYHPVNRRTTPSHCILPHSYIQQRTTEGRAWYFRTWEDAVKKLAVCLQRLLDEVTWRKEISEDR